MCALIARIKVLSPIFASLFEKRGFTTTPSGQALSGYRSCFKFSRLGAFQHLSKVFVPMTFKGRLERNLVHFTKPSP